MQRRIRYILWTVLAACAPLVWLAAARSPAPVIRSLTFQDTFEQGKLSAWEFPFPEDWQILAEGPNHFLHMIRSRPPGVPRRPLQFALLRGPKVGSFELRTRLRREGRSMIVVYNYVDTLHFNYVHLSVDRGAEQPVHNGIFIVDGGPRSRLAGTNAEPALPDQDWHTVRIVRDAKSELTEVFMDDSKRPLFSATAPQFNCGRLGIGSFDETGDFDDEQLHSNDADCESQGILRPASVK